MPKAPWRKLTAAARAAVLRQILDGVRLDSIAQTHGVTVDAVRKIARQHGVARTHVIRAGAGHVTSKHWLITSPTGRQYAVVNLRDWVAGNLSLLQRYNARNATPTNIVQALYRKRYWMGWRAAPQYGE